MPGGTGHGRHPRGVLYAPSRWHLDRLTLSAASYPARIREWWGAQAAANRMIYGAIAIAVVLALAFFAAMRLRGPDYAVLFSNMQPDEANAVIQKLDAEKIPHRLADSGATILVPHEDVYEQRVQLAGQGIVKAGGGTGFELFDRTNLGMTDFQEKIAKTRATEGELQRTISGLTPVQSARVHIATPEASLYSTTQQPTTASVAIQTKPGMQLGAQEVRGITQLVAGAVEGLKPENVTIVDQNGTILRPSALDAGGVLSDASNALKLTQDQLVAKEKYESDLQQSLQGLLDVTIGAHRSAVRVATQMDFDANSTETESYAPQGTVRSQQSEREAYTGNGGARAAAIGVPGTTSNVPTYQGTQSQPGAGRYTKSKTTTNYEVTKALAKHVDAPGKVTRLSVAVLVNAPAPATGTNAAPAAVRRLGDRRREDSQRRRGRRRDRSGPRRPSVGRSDSVRDDARSARRRARGIDDGARHPDRTVRRPARHRGHRRRRLRPGVPAPPHLPPKLGPADVRLVTGRRAPVVRRASHARRHAGDRRADSLGRRPHPRADDRVRHDRRSREPRQHRQARQTLVGRIT